MSDNINKEEAIVQETEVAENVTETKTEAAEAVVETAAEAVEEKAPSMADFEAEVAASMKNIRRGEILDGHVITVTDDELLVNIGYAADGIVPSNEIIKEQDQKLSDLYKVGDVVKAEVLKKDDGEGNVVLSLKKAMQIVVWDELETIYKEASVIKVTPKEVVKGGVTCQVKGVRAFMPASLISAAYVEDLSAFIGKEMEVKVVDFDREKRKVILSRKVIEQVEMASKKDAFYDDIKTGDKFTGTVKKLMNFGAFVNIGPVDGLVRNQDLSWERIKHPSDVVKEGDTVEVTVVEVDKAKKRIGLSLKDIKADPFSSGLDQFKVGQVYEGEVVRVVDFGAFVKLAEGFEGLVHISQLADRRIDDPAEVVKEGDTVKVKLVDISKKDKKIRLSMRDAKLDEERAHVDQYAKEEGNATTSLKDVFGDIFKDLK